MNLLVNIYLCSSVNKFLVAVENFKVSFPGYSDVGAKELTTKSLIKSCLFYSFKVPNGHIDKSIVRLDLNLPKFLNLILFRALHCLKAVLKEVHSLISILDKSNCCNT